MSRLTATLRLDTQLQARNNVYLIIGVAALALSLGLYALFTPQQLHFFMPLVALSGVSLTTFFLVGVLLLLERVDGTLDAIRVSPLRPVEYLASKLVTLSVLAWVESVVIVGVAYGFDVSWGWLALAVFLRAALAGAIGVAVGVRYRAITRFLFPAVAFSVLIDLPVLWYLELWPSSLFFVWPTFPSLLLAKAAFMPVDAAHLVYAVVFGVLAIGIACAWALRSMDRFIVRGGPDS